LGQQPKNDDDHVRRVPGDDDDGRREPTGANHSAPADPIIRRKRRRPARRVRRRPRTGRGGGHRGGRVRVFDQHCGHAAVGSLSDGNEQTRRFLARAVDCFGRAADVRRLVPFRVDVRPRLSHSTGARED